MFDVGYYVSLFFLYLTFFGMPLFTTVWFVVSLCRYLSAKKKNKQNPGTVPQKELRSRKILLILTAVLAGVFLAILLGLIAMAYMAVAYM